MKQSIFMWAAILPLGLSLSCGALSQTDNKAATGTGTSTSDDSGTLEEIIVTAEKRAESVQKTAVSVTSINGSELEQSGKTGLTELLQSVPGVTVQGYTGSTLYVDIRGLGTDGLGHSAATAVYQDGVIADVPDGVYDMARVEVLRGPQGTLYGRSATGGAVNFITNDPVIGRYSADGQLELGSYALIHSTGVLNVPLTDDLSVRVAFNQIKHNGYFDDGLDNLDAAQARIKALYRPNSAFSLLLGYEYGGSHSLGVGNSPVGADGKLHDPYTTTDTQISNNTPTTNYRTWAELNWDLGFARLTYLPGLQNQKTSTIGSAGPFYENASTPTARTTTHELRLASDATDGVRWLGGLYYYSRHAVSLLSGAATAADLLAGNYFFTNNQDASQVSKGVFGQVTVPLTSSLSITGGARYTHDTADDTSTVVTQPFSHAYSKTTWLARLEDNLTDNNLLYGSVATGYRPGGTTGSGNYNNTELNNYNDEALTAYEVGSKNRFLNNRLQLNAGIYYYNYSGFQTPESVCINTVTNDVGLFCFGPNLLPIGSVTAVTPAKFYGGEVELAALLSPNDKVTLAPAYEHGAFTSDTGISGFGVVVPTNGQLPPHVPKWEISASYEHNFHLGNGAVITPHVDARYTSSLLVGFDTALYQGSTSDYLDQYQSATTIANASVSYVSNDEKWSTTVYVNNFTNEIYKLIILPPANAVPSDPRTVGVIFRVNL